MRRQSHAQTAEEAQLPDPVTWGSEIRRATVAGHPCLVLEPHPKSLTEMFRGVARWAARDCIVHGDRRLTYAEVFSAVPAAACRLREVGVRHGDRVMLHAYNTPEWILSLLAIWGCGAMPVLANRWWSAGEVLHSLAAAAPTLVAPMIVSDPRPVLLLTSVDARPLLTLAQLRRAAAEGRVRYVFNHGSCAPSIHTALPDRPACSDAMRWVRAHARDITGETGLPAGSGLLYDLDEPPAR